jgi:hypothetical protein
MPAPAPAPAAAAAPVDAEAEAEAESRRISKQPEEALLRVRLHTDSQVRDIVVPRRLWFC